MKKTDYLYCEDCETFSDLWKYGTVEDAGHSEHRWRYVNDEELAGCVQDCEQEGCFEDW